MVLQILLMCLFSRNENQYFGRHDFETICFFSISAYTLYTNSIRTEDLWFMDVVSVCR